MARIINTADLTETSALDHNAKVLFDLVNDLLWLDEETGKLYWRAPPRRGVSVYKEAGSPTGHGYRKINLKGRGRYYAHQLIWLLTTGELPPKGMDIDHINRNSEDNRPVNLRVVTRSENALNSVKVGRWPRS